MSFFRRMLGLPVDPPQPLTPRTSPAGVSANASAPKKTNVNNPDLPQKVKDKLPALLRRIEEIHARADDDQAMSEMTQLERMRNDHLEKVLGAYLEIPKEHLNEIYVKTGKSASFHLNDAIDKMAGKLEEISRSLAANKINVFEDNTSFVMQNYDDQADTAGGNIFLKGIS